MVDSDYAIATIPTAIAFRAVSSADLRIWQDDKRNIEPVQWRTPTPLCRRCREGEAGCEGLCLRCVAAIKWQSEALSLLGSAIMLFLQKPLPPAKEWQKWEEGGDLLAWIDHKECLLVATKSWQISSRLLKLFAWQESSGLPASFIVFPI